ncbi:hypothetical protein [Cryptosporangium phraense]|uniref:hypothetical protein n=1 Tax=Cryptosporangium phraense TaxID=2593070 RepID=UPI00197AA106|nr:hypothetical protein [Cryptosporangium phraense]
MTTDVRAALQDAVKSAMKSRDRAALSVYRTALAAIANAEALPVEAAPKAGAIEASAVGVGAVEAPRRELSEEDVAAIVRREATDRLTTASSLESADPDAATRLRAEAALLARFV